MLTWINFLHFYQPPNQDIVIVRKVADESYRLILKLLKTYPKLFLTANISGSLLEQLDREEFRDIMDGFKTFLRAGRLELVGSAMYHPILSLLTPDEIERQIRLHDNISRKIFGELYKPKGFFIPEMAYSNEVGRVIKNFGFSWIILDQEHFGGEPNPEVSYSIQSLELGVVFRNRKFSKSFPPEFIITNLASISSPYLITAHDAEVYGHWHKEDHGYYEKIFSHPDISTMTISHYLEKLEKKEYVIPKKTNWEATADDIKSGISFALWYHPKNEIHQRLWRLAKFAINVINDYSDDENYFFARNHLDRGLSSCSWWWASEAKPDVFSPITWNPTVVERGANELMKCIRTLKKLPKEEKVQAEKMHSDLLFLLWKKHWEKYS